MKGLMDPLADTKALVEKAQRGDREAFQDLLETYRDRLPVTEATPVISLGEGATPLVPSRRIGERLGVDVFVKPVNKPAAFAAAKVSKSPASAKASAEVSFISSNISIRTVDIAGMVRG